MTVLEIEVNRKLSVAQCYLEFLEDRNKGTLEERRKVAMALFKLYRELEQMGVHP